jgi:hypothetical protein
MMWSQRHQHFQLSLIPKMFLDFPQGLLLLLATFLEPEREINPLPCLLNCDGLKANERWEDPADPDPPTSHSKLQWPILCEEGLHRHRL